MSVPFATDPESWLNATIERGRTPRPWTLTTGGRRERLGHRRGTRSPGRPSRAGPVAASRAARGRSRPSHHDLRTTTAGSPNHLGRRAEQGESRAVALTLSSPGGAVINQLWGPLIDLVGDGGYKALTIGDWFLMKYANIVMYVIIAALFLG